MSRQNRLFGGQLAFPVIIIAFDLDRRRKQQRNYSIARSGRLAYRGAECLSEVTVARDELTSGSEAD